MDCYAPHLGPVPSPIDLVAGLDRVVVGQDAAKRALALAAYRHYLGVAKRMHITESAFGNQHILLLGPTGCGKTQLVRELARLLDVPLAMVSATSYVEAGYVGEKVDSIPRTLYVNARGRTGAAERGMVFIDEVDKIRAVHSTFRDVSGAGVQHALLKLLDGIDVMLDLGDRHQSMRTQDIFFIFAGAFEGVDDIVRRRTQTAGGIGFRQGQRGTSGPQTPRPSVAIEDLIEFGMVREFVGRLATIAEVQPLDVGALARILVEPRNSWLERTKRFFAAHGAELHLSRGAIRALAERAADQGTGARALDRVATAALESTVWRLLRSEQPVARVEVTRTTVERGVEARFRLGSCLRLRPRPGPPPKVHPTASEPAQAEPVHCTAAEYRAAIDLLEGELCLDQAAKPAQAWWRSFRAAHDHEPRELHDLALQLRERRTTIHELFLATASAQTEDLRAVLHYLDSKRLLDAEEQQRKSET